MIDPHHSPATKLTYRELDSLIQQFAAGLAHLGLTQGDKVGRPHDKQRCLQLTNPELFFLAK